MVSFRCLKLLGCFFILKVTHGFIRENPRTCGGRSRMEQRHLVGFSVARAPRDRENAEETLCGAKEAGDRLSCREGPRGGGGVNRPRRKVPAQAPSCQTKTSANSRPRSKRLKSVTEVGNYQLPARKQKGTLERTLTSRNDCVSVKLGRTSKTVPRKGCLAAGQSSLWLSCHRGCSLRVTHTRTEVTGSPEPRLAPSHPRQVRRTGGRSSSLRPFLHGRAPQADF